MSTNHESEKLFSADKAARLDSAERHALQPADKLVDTLELTPHSHVLDYGAGTGYFAVPIARRLIELGNEGAVCAVDAQVAMLDHLRAKLDAPLASVVTLVHGRTAEISALAESGRRCDRVLLANTYHEVEDVEALLAAIARVLEPGGLLYIVDWRSDGSTDQGPPLAHRVNAREVDRVLLAAGYEDIEHLEIYREHYTLRARRGS